MHFSSLLPFFISDWQSLLRTLLVGIPAYVALIILLRISGKRTLSKMNAFDFVVTIALGSVLATILISREVTLAEGITALLLLIGMQFIITAISVRSRRFSKLIKSEPRLLLHNGEMLPAVMRAERVTQDELEAAARSNGIENLRHAESIVLETDGSLTVMTAIPPERR